MKYVLPAAAALLITSAHGALATNYSVQNDLTGATAAHSNGYVGAGVVFGDIDTGIQPQWIGFSSQYNTALAPGASNIDTVNSAVCIGNCPTGAFPTDGNGHGTFTASQLASGVQSANFAGVDPAAKVVAVQVLSASGSGTSTDVANGIVYAVNHGAEILNLSLGPGGFSFQQRAFYQSLANAINYAASKNAIIVFAGGNSSQNLVGGLSISGFTDAALQHMFFMGSTTVGDGVHATSVKLSSFSNKPGNGYFFSTTGKRYYYKNMWMMADGENIWGASISNTGQCAGYGCVQQDSGTSMAAPQGAGAAGLLAARWPVLITNGTIPQILENSATHLGAAGANTVYGDGFLNITAAMQAVGPLSVSTGSGQLVPLTNGGIVSSGALGNMAKVSSALQNMVGFDYYHRDYPVSLGAAIVTKAKSGLVSPSTAQVMGQTGVATRTVSSFGEGNWLAFSGSPAPAAPEIGRPNTQLVIDPAHAQQNEWSYAFSENGRYMGVGQGSNASLSFDDARWGAPSAFFDTGASASGALLGLVSNANYATVGVDVSKDSRLAVQLLTAKDDSLLSQTGSTSTAHGAAAAYTISPSDGWKVSLTSSFLNESDQLLGSVSGGYLGLGPSATTVSVGAGTNVNLGGGYQIGFDAAYSTTNPTHNPNSLITDTSRLQSESYGMALSKHGLIGLGDTLGVSVVRPMRVVSGTANLAVPVGQDALGNPIFQQQRVGLSPNGTETDLGLAYNRPFSQDMLGGVSLSYRDNADNIAGTHDAAAMAHFRLSF